ncbi:MAG: cyclohexanone monooxygenase [Chloroflexi bacterium]|nr:MAG: cyclohexanone monooxygenase [Chloroflexota bacterium]
MAREPRETSAVQTFDALIVGAGLSGLYMLHRLRALGLSTLVLEQADGVGGTWYWNRYPGARCDIESLDYSYSFSPELEQEWTWSQRYAEQAEILEYINYVADRFDLRRDILFNTRVVSAHYNDAAAHWTLATEAGEQFVAKYCIMALGCLSAPQTPNFPGLEQFRGEWYQTGAWPHHPVDFRGKRVAVVGTGSSGIQSIPVIARDAEHLYVFQRTPNFSVPAHNRPADPAEVQRVKAHYAQHRERNRTSHSGFLVPRSPNMERSALEVDSATREQEYWWRWNNGGFGLTSAFNDLYSNLEANATAAAFVHDRIREIVRDPQVAELLIPRDHPIGTKRLCVDTDYYATYNRENVSLVNVRATPIVGITPAGIRTTAAEYAVDILVFAIGFDAMTGPLLRIDIRGSGGIALRDVWAGGPRTYLGIAIAGFPNMFTITGPGSPSVLSNMIISIEQHVEWVSECIEYLEEHQVRKIEATVAAQDAWVDRVNQLGEETLYPLANSWYVGANIPGKPRVFMPYVGGVGTYREECATVAEQGYAGFALTT